MKLPKISLKKIISESQCYEAIRELRWPEQVECPHCNNSNIIKKGKDSKHPERQRYQCKNCNKHFDDLSNTILSGHHQPLSTWILCLYLMGLNLSNLQISKELELNKDDVQYMTEYLRNKIHKKNKPSTLRVC